jgi:Tfp pilus assembly protein PilV
MSKRTTHNSLPTTHLHQRGFTLIEVLLFVGMFSIMVVAFMSIFVSVSDVSLRQTSAAEVGSQSQYLLQTIQFYVERSSVIDLAKDTATSTLKLRMASSTEDPTIIRLSGTAVTLQQAGGAVITLTSSKVNVANLVFTKAENPPGHDSVAISFTIQNSSANLKQKFLEAFNTSVARVSAASFDSNVVPSANNTYGLGAAAGDWKSINNTIYFAGSKVGIGVSSPSSTLQVTGGDVYIDTANQGLILKAPNGTSCYRLTVTNTGTLATSTIGC